MSEDKYAGIEEFDLGIQDDGEPAVVTEATPETPETEAAPEVETAEAEKPTEEEAKPEETQHKKPGSQRARERAERAETRAKQLEERLAALEKGKTEPHAPAVPSYTAAREAFFAQYPDAQYTDFVIHQAKQDAKAEILAELEQKKQREEFEAKANAWKQADAKFGATKPDWDDAIEDLHETVQTFNQQNAPGFPALDAALSASDIAPALKYHFGKNPDELRKVASLDPIGAIKALAWIEAKLTRESDSSPTQPKTSKAPPPVRPVPGGSAVVTDTRFGGIEEF